VVCQGEILNVRIRGRTSTRQETTTKKAQTLRSSPYATGADFCRIFEENMNSLYLLSFLLTADNQKAKQCLVSGLENATEAPPVFREWANSWARRTIIQSAIRLLEPRPVDEKRVAHTIKPSFDDRTFASEQSQIMAVLDLPPFERFVFVLSVLERHSNQDCSLLLGCSRRDVIAAQSQALQKIGTSIELDGTSPFGTATMALD